MACTGHYAITTCGSHYTPSSCSGHSTSHCTGNSSSSCVGHSTSSCVGQTNPWTCPSHKADVSNSGSIYRSPCPNNYVNLTDPTITARSTIVKAYHINELRIAINREQTRRKNLVANRGPSAATPANPCPSNVVTSFGTSPSTGVKVNNALLVELRNAINLMRSTAWNENIKVETDAIPEAAAVNEIRSKIRALEVECLCNCNYCTCNCNYCTCACNYSCTCRCNYACTCRCNYSCTCRCNYSCTCVCNYCTCNCYYNCTCACAYR